MIEYAIPAKYKNLVSRSRLDLALKTTLDNAGFSGEEGVNLKLTDNKTIQKLNREYRSTDEPTDVLSFENDYLNPENGIHYLGDIVISVEKAQTQADANGNTLYRNWKCSSCMPFCTFVAMTILSTMILWR